MTTTIDYPTAAIECARYIFDSDCEQISYWKSYVEKMLWSEFGITRDDGDYEDFLNKTIEIRKLKITTKEV